MRYGYFGGPEYDLRKPAAWSEISDHCNLGFIGSWFCNAANLAELHAQSMHTALTAGIKEFVNTIDVLCYDMRSFVPLPVEQIDANLKAYFEYLRLQGLLSAVVGLYPIDEPDLHGLNDSDVQMVNARIHFVLSEFVPNDTIKLVCCYGSGFEQPLRWYQRLFPQWFKPTPRDLPGFSSYDVVGADNYGNPMELLAQYDRVMRRLTIHQDVILIPGGASPWQNLPDPFIAWAQANREHTFAVCPFVWFDTDGGNGVQTPGTGIRNNGGDTRWRAAGTVIRGL